MTAIGTPTEDDELHQMKPTSSQGEFAPVFKAVTTPSQRRGIRLEAIYWQSLKRLADAEECSIGEMVQRVAVDAGNGSNLASAIRVSVARWLTGRVDKLDELNRIEAISPLVQASPVATFVITSEKRIVLYNRQLVELIQTQFPTVRSDIFYKGLRLQIDVQVGQAIERLKAGNSPVLATGFVIGIEGRRLRGSLNLVLAPIQKHTMLMAYITSPVEAY